MKYSFLFVLFNIFYLQSQTIVENHFITDSINFEIVEVELKKDDVVTIKNIFVFINNNEIQEAERIKCISDVIKENWIKNSVFYFFTIDSLYSKGEKEKIVYYSLETLQERKMMLDSNLYIFSDWDYTAYYKTVKVENDKLEVQGKTVQGFIVEIKDILLGKSQNEIKNYILKKI